MQTRQMSRTTTNEGTDERSISWIRHNTKKARNRFVLSVSLNLDRCIVQLAKIDWCRCSDVAATIRKKTKLHESRKATSASLSHLWLRTCVTSVDVGLTILWISDPPFNNRAKKWRCIFSLLREYPFPNNRRTAWDKWERYGMTLKLVDGWWTVQRSGC